MSGFKDNLIQQMEDDEDKKDWIRDQLGNSKADESSIEWAKQSELYDSVVQKSTRRDNIYYEMPWLSNAPPKNPYSNFKTEIVLLLRIVKNHPSDEIKLPYLKMSYAYSITLLEAFLEDTLKINIATNETYRNNAINKIDELKRAKYSLAELAITSNNLDTLIFRTLSGFMYHNIPKMNRIFSEVFDHKMEFESGDLIKVIANRHDIVHRNGKSENGDFINPTEEDVLSAIHVVINYVDNIQSHVSASNYSGDDPF